jgi:hypothetical protein
LQHSASNSKDLSFSIFLLQRYRTYSSVVLLRVGNSARERNKAVGSEYEKEFDEKSAAYY